MFGYHKPKQKYPIASKLELLGYAFTFFISASYVILDYANQVGNVVPSQMWVTYAFIAAVVTFLLGLISTIWMIEKKDER